MPLQNRVTPDGRIDAVAARGTMLGFRGGCFHRPDKTLRERQWGSQQWICCVLSFKGRRRQVFSPGRITELFFLDEATALAAGQRPCFECRRADAVAFAAAWAKAQSLATSPRAPQMDVALHGERWASAPHARQNQRILGDLPDGVFVLVDTWPALIRGGRLWRWSHEGYSRRSTIDRKALVRVITPPSTIAAISAGYRPTVHRSAGL